MKKWCGPSSLWGTQRRGRRGRRRCGRRRWRRCLAATASARRGWGAALQDVTLLPGAHVHDAVATPRPRGNEPARRVPPRSQDADHGVAHGLRERTQPHAFERTARGPLPKHLGSLRRGRDPSLGERAVTVDPDLLILHDHGIEGTRRSWNQRGTSDDLAGGRTGRRLLVSPVRRSLRRHDHSPCHHHDRDETPGMRTHRHGGHAPAATRGERHAPSADCASRVSVFRLSARALSTL